MTFPCLFAFSLVALLAQLALCIPQVSASSLSASNNASASQIANHDLGAVPLCINEILRTATTRDCIGAAIRMPESAKQADFHTIERGVDTWQLPWTNINGGCNVTVSLSPGMKETASWDRIAQSTSDMIALCSTGHYPQGRVAGKLSMGSGGLIKVNVEKATKQLGDESGGESTAVF